MIPRANRPNQDLPNTPETRKIGAVGHTTHHLEKKGAESMSESILHDRSKSTMNLGSTVIWWATTEIRSGTSMIHEICMQQRIWQLQ